MTQQEFAQFIGIKRSSLGAYEEGRAKPNLYTIRTVSKKLRITIDRLLNEDLSKTAAESIFGEQPITGGAPQDIEGNKLRVLSISVGEDGKENIELVHVKAAAGYLAGYSDPQYIEQLPKFRLPFLPTGTYRAFEIKGDSMLPMNSGSIVVGEYVENWKTDIKNGKTYIVISNDGIVYKRLNNNILSNGKLTLHSDNPAYKPYNLSVENVLEVWQPKAYVSQTLPEPANEVTLDRLTGIVMDLQKEVLKIKDKI